MGDKHTTRLAMWALVMWAPALTEVGHEVHQGLSRESRDGLRHARVLRRPRDDDDQDAAPDVLCGLQDLQLSRCS